ncbi:MAG: NAD(P)H-hydrate dehydratase [bacterium]
MQDIDLQAINTYGIPGLVLMENAGIRVVDEMFRSFPDLRKRRVIVVCGKGNNGGDGFVVARHLHNKSVNVQVVMLGQATALPPDAFTNYSICANMQIPVIKLLTQNHLKLLEKLLQSQVSIVVDAIMGIGFSADLKPFIARVADIINASEAKVVAVDIPTGLSSTTGHADKSAVKADLTVTFALPKIGHYLLSSRELTGALKVTDIGIPPVVYEKDDNLRVDLLTKERVKSWIPVRRADSHKGTYGHTLVVAGSKGMSGAAVMNALGAYKAGAGKVTLAVPESILDQVASQVPEMMTATLPETDQGYLSQKAIVPVLNLSKGKSVLVIGSGLSNETEIRALVAELINKMEIPMIIDADGINAIKLAALKYANIPVILTPHPGEMAALLDISTADVQENRLDAAQKTAKASKSYFLLKGNHTVIAGPDGNTFVNTTGNPGMATGGAGDVLSGMIGGLISRGLKPLPAAAAGAFIHGLAGDIAAGEYGQESMMTGDIINSIAEAYREVTC